MWMESNERSVGRCDVESESEIREEKTNANVMRFNC